VLRLWTATDQCGNFTNAVQTISVIDTTKPSLVCPTIRVQCAADVPAPYSDLAAFLAAGGTATDSCSPTLSFSLISASGLVGRCPGQVTRVYRVTDVCGNVAEGTQTITVDDTIPPVLACVNNVTLECGEASLDPEVTGSPTATDNCTTNVLITYSDAEVPANYDLKFYVADPDSGTGPYSPTYLEFGPDSLPCPEDARLTGRALDPLRNAVAYAPSGQLDALTSIGNVPLAFGQIVPFETVIQVTGGVGPERGTIEFTAAWSTYTTSNNRFGYDPNYMVYCAFVDAADPGSIDPNLNARVESYSSMVINPGTIAERIQGTFRVSGLDSGDRVVVEIWMVLMSSMESHSGGTVAADLVSAQTASVPPVPITIGNQTDSLGNLSKIGTLPPPQQQPPLGPLPSQPPALPGATVSLINRTWTATDDCGNSSQCVQAITVRDTTPPTILCPPDRSVLEGDAWTFEQPVATDLCGTVTVRLLDTTTNLTSQTSYLVTRLWGAYDQSGNSATCQQNVTIQKAAVPALQIKRIDLANVELSWAAPSTGCQLEVCDNSQSYYSWTTVPVAPVVIYGRNVVVLPSTSSQKFYRLRKGP
ncbi:MAG TPA: HYR domain-containing protein, partial [Verrucomicrobiae bacterium]|nr:HYR domain-containing protein [Verrucomicrobiae bacterium]